MLVATSDCSLLVVSESGSDGNSIEDQLLQQKIPSPITKISLAPNAKFLACYRKDGVLTVMSSSFTTKVSYTYMHAHTHIYTYIHTYIHAYTLFIHVHTQIYTCTHTCMHTHIYTYIHTYIHTHIHTCTHIHTYTHTYIILTHIHIHTPHTLLLLVIGYYSDQTKCCGCNDYVLLTAITVNGV